MTEIVVETTTPLETVIEIEGGPVLTTTVAQEVQTVVEQSAETYVIDLNSGARGEPGSAILAGTGMPDMITGSVGDAYVVTEGEGVGMFLIKREDSWEIMGNIRGPVGGIATVNNMIGPHVTIDKYAVGLNNVDNTSDILKPISTATQSALDGKRDKVWIQNGSGLGRDLVTQGFYTPTLNRYMRINTSLKTSEGSMLSVRITGFNYSSRGYIDGIFTAYMYNTGGGQIHLPQWINRGDYSPIVEAYSDADNNLVIVLDGTWAYARLAVVETTTQSTDSIRNWQDGWTITNTATLDGLTPGTFTTKNYDVVGKIAEAKAAADSKEPLISTSNTTTYYRGDKTWQTLNSSSVGLGNVSNSAQVDLSSNQTITGHKNFTASISVPDTGGLRVGTSTVAGRSLVANSTGYASWGVPTVIPAKSPTDAADTYPQGVYAFESSGTTPTWPDQFGTVLTSFISGDRAFQLNFGKSNGVLRVRTGESSSTNGWREWTALADDSKVVHNTGSESIAGIKTFTGTVHVPAPNGPTQASTKKYVDDTISGIIDAAPGTLDTLNELAAALGDDPNFATTVTNQIATKEPIINAGTTAQYWRGDKTWQTLDKAAVGLSNVDNTSDAAKPVSTAQQTALNAKAPLASPTFTGTVSGISKAMVGLGSVDNTSDAAKPISTATQSALDNKIGNKEVLKKTDPFFGGRWIYMPELHNGLFRAADRFTVTGKLHNSTTNAVVSTLSDAQVAAFFDGNYDSSFTVPLGQYLLVNITFPTTYPGYPYGDYIIASYYNGKPASTSARFYTLYAPHGGPAWKTLSPNVLIDAGTNYQVAFNNQNYQISQMEFRVDSPATGTEAKISQIEFNPDRPGANETPLFDKYRQNKVYSNTVWTSGGTNAVEISTNGFVIATSFHGSGASLTSLNASNLTGGTVPQARMVQNVQRVVFTTAGTARPSGATYVEWMGPVQPTNMAANDTWINTGA